MSDMNYNNCECDQRESCDCDCKCYCECERCRALAPNRTTLKCGCPGAVTLPLATIAGTNFTVATVTVDTKGFRKPCIKFEFASNIVTTAAVLSLNFQIFKQCKNQLVPIPVGPVWTFSRLVAVMLHLQCSCNGCRCCDGWCYFY